ncbi:hypothetical protein [Cohnella yongneupensis]|uniref:Uncharacterized protein n=1 Tax=Cohnella yongneupensis TaxID=425006 RepID=A0ABW0R3M5_9BACL
MIPSTMYANNVLPVPWTITRHTYDERARRRPYVMPRRNLPTVKQDKLVGTAMDGFVSLLGTAQSVLTVTRELLRSISYVPRDAASTPGAISETAAVVIEQAKRLVQSYNDIHARLSDANDYMRPSIRQTLSDLKLLSAFAFIGISQSAEGRLRLDEERLQVRMNGHDANKALVGMAVLATTIHRVFKRITETPLICLLNMQVPELQPCTAYRSSKQAYLLLPMKGLLLNRKA